MFPLSMLWPIVIAFVITALAYGIFYFLPTVVDFGKSFLWIIAGFLLIYVGAAIYLSRSIPAIGGSSQSIGNGIPASENTQVTDHISP